MAEKAIKPPCVQRKKLADLLRNCYFENRRRYGSGRIAKALGRSGINIGRRKVRTLMAEENLKAIQPKAFKPQTTNSRGVTAASHLLTEIKSEEWVAGKIIIGDIRSYLINTGLASGSRTNLSSNFAAGIYEMSSNYIRLRGGKFAYLAIWQDKVTRRIVGWSSGLEMIQELAISALEKAVRKGLIEAGDLIHSDRGSQCASRGFRYLLQQNGFRQSMSGRGNC